MASPEHRRAAALMFCAGLLWSIAGVFTRHLEQAPRWETTFWRSLFCAVAMLAILAAMHRRQAVEEVLRLGRTGLASGALWAVMFTGFMLALTQTSTANTLILTSISPLTASLFAWLLLGERVPGRTWLLIGVAFSGILVMFGGEAGGGRMAGNLIALSVPLADVVTPNLNELAQLTGNALAQDEAEMLAQGRQLLAKGAKAALLKGGHWQGCEEARDWLVQEAADPQCFVNARVPTANTHGTGCTLASAIAALYPHRRNLNFAVAAAKSYLHGAIASGQYWHVGQGAGPLAHFWRTVRD